MVDIFSLGKSLLYKLDPELAHNVVILALRYGLLPAHKLGNYPNLNSHLLGMDFAHPTGLAAGFDKDARCINGLIDQGFSFVEVGTVTPLSQAGNARPRLFRLEEDLAIINRMGFNNKGSDRFLSSLMAHKKGIVGVNIGKNKDTENAIEDYLYLLDKFYVHANYITVNISSPNTPGLRALQNRQQFAELLTNLIQKKSELATQHVLEVPLLVKIAPDLSLSMIEDISQVMLDVRPDGIIISNTTIGQRDVLRSNNAGQIGGLSGVPLRKMSNEVLSAVYKLTEGQIPIIGSGGVFTGDDAYEKIKLGASLVQIYSALIYEGFGVINKINCRLSALLMQDGYKNITEAVGSAHRH